MDKKIMSSQSQESSQDWPRLTPAQIKRVLSINSEVTKGEPSHFRDEVTAYTNSWRVETSM